jgi:hypothetical protein
LLTFGQQKSEENTEMNNTIERIEKKLLSMPCLPIEAVEIWNNERSGNVFIIVEISESEESNDEKEFFEELDEYPIDSDVIKELNDPTLFKTVTNEGENLYYPIEKPPPSEEEFLKIQQYLFKSKTTENIPSISFVTESISEITQVLFYFEIIFQKETFDIEKEKEIYLQKKKPRKIKPFSLDLNIGYDSDELPAKKRKTNLENMK